jgi:hypothetical protein
MPIRSGQRALILAATCLTPLAANALTIGSDTSSVVGVKPGMSQQQFHDVLSEQGYTMIPGSSVTPGANSDIRSDDGTLIGSLFGYGHLEDGTFIQVETGKDGQGNPVAFRVTAIYSLDAVTTDFDQLDAEFETKYGTEFSCVDPQVGAVFHYDAELDQLAEPDCDVSLPLAQAMPRDMVERTLAGEAWAFTATGVKVGPDNGVVTLIESIQDNRLAAKIHAAALGIEAPEPTGGWPNMAAPATPKPQAPQPTPSAPVEFQPSSIEGFLSPGEIGPMPAFLGLEFGMPLGEALAMLEAEGFQYRESFIPDFHRMTLHAEPIWYDTTMDIAFMPYPQSVLQELKGKEPPIRFKGFLAHRKNADGSIDTAGGSIVQSVDYKGVDPEGPIVRIVVSRQFPRNGELPIMDWLNAIRTEGQKFGGGCISRNPEEVKLFTKDGGITGRPHDDANGCMEWELVHEHRYRALMVDDYIDDPSVTGGRRMRKVEILIDDHQAIEEALRR